MNTPVRRPNEDIPPGRDPVVCPCGFRIYDGEVIRSRVIRVMETGCEAKCCRCKRWSLVPITYCPILEA